MGNVGMVVTELPAPLHRRAKIAAVTQGLMLRELVARAVEAYLLVGERAEPKPEEKVEPQKKASKRQPKLTAEDVTLAESLEIAESVMTVGKPVASIAEERPFAGLGKVERRALAAMEAVGDDVEKNPFAALK
jgi:hypothetical protein